MKKIILSALCAALLCSGCWSTKNEIQDIIYDTGNNNNYNNDYGNNNNGNNNNADTNTNKHYSTVAEAMANEEGMTYYDFLLKYTDLIVSECETVTYQQLMRSIDGMEGECAKVTGEFSQVLSQNVDGLNCIVGLINITYVNDGYYQYYDDPVYFMIPVEAVSTRPVVGDKATLWGICDGFDTFEMASGALETLPTLATAKVQFLN